MNLEEIKRKQKEYYLSNREGILKKKREYYLKNKEEINEKSRKYHKRVYEGDRLRIQNFYKGWVERNREKHRDFCLKNYYNNKEIWKERCWTNRNRKEFIKIISVNGCSFCGNKEVKIIHHRKYGDYKNYLFNNRREEKLKLLKDYAENILLGFCSNLCHRNYERTKNERLINTNIHNL